MLMICMEIYPLFAALWLSHIARKALTPGRVSGPPRERQPQGARRHREASSGGGGGGGGGAREKERMRREKGGSNRRSSGYGVIADIVVKIAYFCLVFVFVLESGHVVAID